MLLAHVVVADLRKLAEVARRIRWQTVRRPAFIKTAISDECRDPDKQRCCAKRNRLREVFHLCNPINLTQACYKPFTTQQRDGALIPLSCPPCDAYQSKGFVTRVCRPPDTSIPPPTLNCSHIFTISWLLPLRILVQ